MARKSVATERAEEEYERGLTAGYRAGVEDMQKAVAAFVRESNLVSSPDRKVFGVKLGAIRRRLSKARDKAANGE